MAEDSKALVIGCLSFLYGLGAIFLAVAWFGLPFGAANHGLRIRFAPDLVYTTGTVVSVRNAGTSTHPAAQPVVEYFDGTRKQVFYGVGSSNGGFHVGDEVPVAFSRSHRDIVYIRQFWQMYFLAILMIIFAAPCLALAIRGTYAQFTSRPS